MASVVKYPMLRRLTTTGLLFLGIATHDAWGASGQASIGLNKFDLAQQYFGLASGGNGSPSYVAVEQAMARKAIVDASNDGVSYFRVAVTGFAPAAFQGPNDLALWLSDPKQYWAVMDHMMDDLRRRNFQIVATLMFNPLQFPSISGETLADLIDNPQSRSWQLFAKYVTEFIKRYRNKNVIKLYEMTNELNVSADIDLLGYCRKKQNPLSCKVTSNFTSSDLIEFTKRVYDLIKNLDPVTPISTGFALPRPSAEHLRRHPVFLGGKASWIADTMDQAETNLRALNQYADVLSVHIYPKSSFGNLSAESPIALLTALNNEAIQLKKPLFIGEFGDKVQNENGSLPFVKDMLAAIEKEKISYSALWVWEFYQSRTYLTYNTPPTLYNLEPGYTDGIIATLKNTNAQLQNTPVVIPEDTLPQVVITYPLDCQRLMGPFKVYAVASSGGHSVNKVEFQWDDTVIGRALNPPYVAVVPFNKLTMPGSHELVATAYAQDGVKGQFKIVINPDSKTKISSSKLCQSLN